MFSDFKVIYPDSDCQFHLYSINKVPGRKSKLNVNPKFHSSDIPIANLTLMSNIVIYHHISYNQDNINRFIKNIDRGDRKGTQRRICFFLSDPRHARILFKTILFTFE